MRWLLAAGEYRYVTVEGLRLRVSTRGKGPPLLLVMGLGGSIEHWEPLVEQLGRFTTIAFDAPGTGESETPRRPLRMPELARLTTALLDAVGHCQVDVLGVFLGRRDRPGAGLPPPRARAPAGPGGDHVRRGRHPGPAGRAGPALSTPHRYYSRAHFKAVAGRLYGGEIARRPDLLDRQAYSRLNHAPSLRGYLWQLAAIAGWSSLPYLHRVRQPALVLTGDDDPIIRVLNGRILARALPDARLHVIPGGGHLFLVDQARESAALIADFLRGLSGRRGRAAHTIVPTCSGHAQPLSPFM